MNPAYAAARTEGDAATRREAHQDHPHRIRDGHEVRGAGGDLKWI